MRYIILLFLIFSLPFTHLTYAKGLTEDQAQRKPIFRIGSFPFPSILYEEVPDDLGEHSYEGKKAKTDKGYGRFFPVKVETVGRGIMYTCRAGFLDMAHIRAGIDYTGLFVYKIKNAMKNSLKSIDLQGQEQSVHKVTFNYPDDWKNLSESELEKKIDQIALVGGQYLAHISLTWHEIVTWYGWSSTFIKNAEKSSAFSYDDIMSHMIGVHIAGRAISNRSLEFNEAVKIELDKELNINNGKLIRLNDKKTTELAKRMKGRWYKAIIFPIVYDLKRITSIGLDGEMIYGCQVPDVNECAGIDFIGVSVPGMTEFQKGGIYEGIIQVTIDPVVPQKSEILKGLPNQMIDVEKDLKPVMKRIEELMLDEYGTSVIYRRSP